MSNARRACVAALAAASFLIAGCESKPAATPASQEPVVNKTPQPPSRKTKDRLAAVGRPIRTTPPDKVMVEKKLCESARGPCVLTKLEAAQDSKRKLYVAEIAYVANPDDKGAWKEPNFENEDQCNTWALFLVASTGPTIETTRELARFCNDGHGASGVGEDRWSVKNGRLTLSTNGGSNWRWDTEDVLNLETGTPVSTRTTNYFATGPEIIEERSWGYDTFSGKTTWSVMPCGGQEGESVENAAWSIPAVPLPESFIATEWKTTSLGSCATTLDSSGETGFIIHGEKAQPSEARMKVVASADRELFVEVYDDKFVPSASGNWIHADHLELWLSPDEPRMMQMECVNPKDKGTTWQWGIDATNGSVHVAHGKPASELHAERAAFEGGVRFKITVPPEAKSITLVYSDSDDGRSQERLLATSTFKFARVQTMGDFAKISPDKTTCSLSGKALTASVASTTKLFGNAN